MVETKTKYSVWFTPEPEQAQVFIDLITDLAIQYQAPLFVPHVTLAADLTASLPEILAQTQHLAAQLSPFEIMLSEPSTGETYFQCVFLKATLSEELGQARRAAAEVYQQPQLADSFMPHLSLLYGMFDDTVKTLVREVVVSRLSSAKFTVNNVVVYTAQPDPQSWQEVGKFNLNK